MVKKFRLVWVEIAVENPNRSFEILSNDFEFESEEYQTFEAKYRASCKDLGISVREELLPEIFMKDCRDKLIRERIGKEFRYVEEERCKDRIVDSNGGFYGYAMWHGNFT